MFFWSEEQARAHRRRAGEVLGACEVNGTYMTLSQAAYVTPLVQGAIFPVAPSTA